MKTAPDILRENPISLKDLMGPNGAELVQHLIWLGQVEVIKNVSSNESQEVALMDKIKYKENLV